MEPEQSPSEADQQPLRLFIAIDLPSEVKFRLADLQSRLKTGARFVDAHPRWVSTENLHLTLIFLGATLSAKVPELESLIDEAVTMAHPFELGISKLELFPPVSKNPKVLAMDIASQGKALQKLHGHLVEILRRAGYDLENRPYRPHLTLARLTSTKTASRIAPLVASHAGMVDVKFPVNEVVLFQSHLGQEGPTYKELHKSSL